MVSSVCFDYEDEDVSNIDFNIDSDSDIADMSEDEMEELASGMKKKPVSTKKADTPKKSPAPKAVKAVKSDMASELIESAKVQILKAPKPVKVPKVKAVKVPKVKEPKIQRIAPDGFRGRKEITLNGMIFKSRSEAAKFLVDSGKSFADTAELCGMTYSTVYAVTKGKEKIKARLLAKKNLKVVKAFLNDDKAKAEAREEVKAETSVKAIIEKAVPKKAKKSKELSIKALKDMFGKNNVIEVGESVSVAL